MTTLTKAQAEQILWKRIHAGPEWTTTLIDLLDSGDTLSAALQTIMGEIIMARRMAAIKG